MTRARSFTAVELLLAITLTAIIAGTVVSVYVFVATRVAHMTSEMSVAEQVSKLRAAMAPIIQDAVEVEIKSSGGQRALVCTMPAIGHDDNGDGVKDRYEPLTVDLSGGEQWGKGERIWFYQADDTGVLGTAGRKVFMAKRLDDSNPSGLDVHEAFNTYHGSSTYRYNYIDNLAFSVDDGIQIATVDVKASKEVHDNVGRKAASAAKARLYEATHSFKVYWRREID